MSRPYRNACGFVFPAQPSLVFQCLQAGYLTVRRLGCYITAIAKQFEQSCAAWHCTILGFVGYISSIPEGFGPNCFSNKRVIASLLDTNFSLGPRKGTLGYCTMMGRLGGASPCQMCMTVTGSDCVQQSMGFAHGTSVGPQGYTCSKAP